MTAKNVRTSFARVTRSCAGLLLVALVAAACAQGSDAVQAAASSDDVEAIPTAAVAATAAVGATATAAPAADTATVVPAAQPTARPTAAAAASSSSLRSCVGDQFPIEEQIEVVNIPANDPDGGLVIHTEPDVSSPATAVATQGSILNTWAEPTYGGCVVLPSQAVWWAIVDYDGNLAWVNSAYASPFIEGHGGGPGAADGEEEDASFDCVLLDSLPNTCISVIYQGNNVTVLENPASLPVEYAQVDCVYGGQVDACFVLQLAGFGERNFGLGNSLSQTPTEALRDDCNNFGTTTGAGALACAELAIR